MSDEITTTMEQKFADLDRIRADAEEQRVKAWGALKKERDDEARKQRELLAELMAAQAEEAKERAKRQELWNKVLAGVGAVLAALSGGAVYTATRTPTEAEAKAAAQPVVQEVRRETRDIEDRVNKAETKIERLKDVALEQQVQIADDGEYTRDLIRAAHKERASDLDSVEVPDTVRAAKTKADAIKRRRAEESRELFDETAADPFAGID